MSKQIIDVSILHGILQNGTREQKLLSIDALEALARLNLIAQNQNSTNKLLEKLNKFRHVLNNVVTSDSAFYCVRYNVDKSKIYVQATDSWEVNKQKLESQQGIEFVWVLKTNKTKCVELMDNFWAGYYNVYDGSFYSVNELQVQELCDGLNTWVHSQNDSNTTLTGCWYIIQYPKANPVSAVMSDLYQAQAPNIYANHNFVGHDQVNAYPQYNGQTTTQLPTHNMSHNTQHNMPHNTPQNVMQQSIMQNNMPQNTIPNPTFTQNQNIDGQDKTQNQKTIFGFIKALINREIVMTTY